MLEKDLDELIENQEQVIEALKQADHFYVCHYCKKREQIEPVSYTHLTLPTIYSV